MALPAVQVLPERVAPLVGLVRQLHVAPLAHVAVHVEVLLHGHDAHGLVGAVDGRDGVAAGGALGREDAVEVVDAVDLVVEVHGEGHAVQALVAHAAAEAAGMVRLPHGLQDLQ